MVIGLGSMGKRRIRCLKSLGYTTVAGFDMRSDRCSEASEKYNIQTYDNYHDALNVFGPDALIISVPPDKHNIYIKSAIEKGIHFFVEASVVDGGLGEFILQLRHLNIVAAPSATMLFHPAIKLIKSIVESGELGKISNIILHSGQYLPDWHTYEPVSDFYVSNRETGGGREIVPFELTWFCKLFGWPRRVAANFRKTIDISGAEYIDDTYNILLDYSNYLAVVTVDVVSRYATRRLIVNGSERQLFWSWDENTVRVYSPLSGDWDRRSYDMGTAEGGYNTNIGEKMYVEEIRQFIMAIRGEEKFPNSMEEDLRVLELLYKSERSDILSSYIEV